MTSCRLVGRVLPFALTFLCGVALWQALGERVRVANDVLRLERGARVLPRERAGTWAAARPEGEGSRTWLVIRSGPTVESERPEGVECGHCSVQMRVLFGGDGEAVPGNRFSVSPAAYPLIEDAVAAAKNISFTPAMKNGRPIPLWANVTYECGYISLASMSRACRLTVGKDSARTWDGRPWRVVLPYE